MRTRGVLREGAARSRQPELRRADSVAESTLRGHLKAQGQEETGSQSYVPPDPKDDKALKMADDLLRGTIVNADFPANPKTRLPN